MEPVSNYMKTVNLIIFDLDGTLIDSKLDLANSVNHTLGQLGHQKKDVDLIAKFIGRGLSNFIKNTLGEVGEEKLQNAREIFMKHYAEHLLDNTVLYPNVKKTLEYFCGKKIVIITNKLSSLTKIILDGLGISGFFQKIIGAGDLPENKPSALPVNTILDIFGEKRENAIIVGDMTIDIQTGKNAGISTCSVTYGLGSRADLTAASPDYVIDDIYELTGLLE